MVDHWLKNSLYNCLPQACLLCGETVSGKQNFALCRNCEGELPILGETCQRCANPLEKRLDKLKSVFYQPALLQTRECGQCLSKQPYFDHGIAFFPYISPFDHFVQAAKFKGKLSTARLLGQLLAQQLVNCIEQLDSLPDGLVPVPLHPSRQRERGYNQAYEMTLPVAKRLQIPIFGKLATRITATPPQTSLSLKQRKKNLQNAFQVHDDLTDLHIAIIDDVMTSGATTNALARKLKQAGAKQVSVWCFCRAEPPS